MRLSLIAPLLILLLAGCGQGGLERLAVGETGKVASVHSGDSFTLDTGLEVRLAGVEAPRGDAPYADEARTALTLLVVGRPVQLLYGGVRRDHYGRALAQVKLVNGGDWVEGVMLRRGEARARTWADNRAMAKAMLEDEAYARNRGLGLWALKDYRVLVPRETEGQPGFQIVEGRVLGSGPGEDGGQRMPMSLVEPRAPVPGLSPAVQPAGSPARRRWAPTLPSFSQWTSRAREAGESTGPSSTLSRLPAMASGVVVSRGSPGRALFNSGSVRSSRVKPSPILRTKRV